MRPGSEFCLQITRTAARILVKNPETGRNAAFQAGSSCKRRASRSRGSSPGAAAVTASGAAPDAPESLQTVSYVAGTHPRLLDALRTLEVLACIAFRQPISQAEIDKLFDADKRGLVVKLRDLKLVEEFAGADGRLRFATTEAFLQRFGLASLQELTATPFSSLPSAAEPLI
jgi:Segregation and condensation complex subunit ScpB